MTEEHSSEKLLWTLRRNVRLQLLNQNVVTAIAAEYVKRVVEDVAV